MKIDNQTKIKELLPIVDDMVDVYQKHRAMLGVAFGNMEIQQIAELITLLKGFIKA